MNQLDQLKQYSNVVADSSDFASIQAFAPQDTTTNPSLILAAVSIEHYQDLLDRAVADHRHSNLRGAALIEKITDRLLVLFGVENPQDRPRPRLH